MTYLKAADILELAMQLEKNGEAYYLAVAQKASPETRALFEDLAQQEVHHFEVFAKLAAGTQDQPFMTDEEWDWYQKYLTATVQSALFQGPDKALAAAADAKTEKEALRMAIEFEKDTLLFYYDLRDKVAAAKRDVIDKVVAEEKSHIRRLAGML